MPRLIAISDAVSLGLHAMALLAIGGGRRFGNQEIAETLGVSGHHLAKVMQRLVRAELVDSASEPRGGFLLNTPANEITLLRIYEAIDGTLNEGGCLLGEPICIGGKCMLGEVLHSLHEQLRVYLNDTTLAKLAESLPFDKMLPTADRNCDRPS
jgi:Rrf2 family protein